MIIIVSNEYSTSVRYRTPTFNGRLILVGETLNKILLLLKSCLRYYINSKICKGNFDSQQIFLYYFQN